MKVSKAVYILKTEECYQVLMKEKNVNYLKAPGGKRKKKKKRIQKILFIS